MLEQELRENEARLAQLLPAAPTQDVPVSPQPPVNTGTAEAATGGDVGNPGNGIEFQGVIMVQDRGDFLVVTDGLRSLTVAKSAVSAVYSDGIGSALVVPGIGPIHLNLTSADELKRMVWGNNAP